MPDDVWDFDSSYESILIDREVKGRMRKLLVHMNKSGLTFVLDRATGEFLGVFSVPEVQNWITGVTEDGKLVGRREPEPGKPLSYCPSVAGAKSWNSMAYSPRTGFIYAPVNEICNNVTATTLEGKEGGTFMNGSFDVNLPPNRTTYSHLDAWDPVTGKRIWSYPYKYVLLASVLATAGDLVFSGDPEGFFFALECAHRREALELSNRRGQSWFGDLLLSQWQAVHRHANGMARVAHRRRGRRPVPRSAMAHGFNAGCIRATRERKVSPLLQIEIRRSCGHACPTC